MNPISERLKLSNEFYAPKKIPLLRRDFKNENALSILFFLFVQ